VTKRLVEHLRLTKQELVDLAGPDHVSQSGADVISADFHVPAIAELVSLNLPSIETFVVAAVDRSIAPMGTNDELNAAWHPTVSAMAESMFEWLDGLGIEVHSDAYITASVTLAADVNEEAHFDDDQFMPSNGVGVVAIVADRAGPRVANTVISIPDAPAPRPLVVDDQLKADFAAGRIDHDIFGAHELVVFPQFGQLHAGPGPCGSGDEARHLLVFRAAT
jgi:hypothetical protein